MRNILQQIVENSPLRVKNSILPLSAFIFSFALYVKTLMPSVGFGDTGDFITASYLLGIPHPTGYPLYTLLGKLFTLIPLSSIAYRVNLVSAFFAALTIAVLYLIVEKITEDKIAAAFASLIFAMSSLFWSQSTQAEVYTLHIFILSLLILISLNLGGSNVRANDGEGTIDHKRLYMFAFILGLGLTNHISVLIYIPAFIFAILDTDWEVIKNVRVMLLMSVCFLSALLFYLYLPLRASVHLPRPWVDPSNIQNFWAYVTAAPYKGYLTYFLPEVAGMQAPRYLSLLLKQFPIYLFVLIPLGIWYFVKKERKILLFLLLFYLTNVGFFINYHVTDIEVFFLPSCLICAIFVGAGIAGLKKLLSELKMRKVYNSSINVFIALVLVASLLMAILASFSRMDRSDILLARDAAEYMLKSAKNNSVILFTGDYIFALEYLQEVEKVRPDVAIVLPQNLGEPVYTAQAKKKYPSLFFPTNPRLSNLEAVQEFIDGNIRRRSIYSERLFDPSLLKKYGNIYRGLLAEVSTRKRGAIVENDKIIDPFQKTDFKALQLERDAWVVTSAAYANPVGMYIMQNRLGKALEVCNEGLKKYPDSAFLHRIRGHIYDVQGKREQAIKEYEEAIVLDPLYGDSYYGLGLIYFQRKDYERAFDLFEKAIFYSVPVQPSHADLFYHQALLAEELGDTTTATKCWEVFIDLEISSLKRIAQAKKHLKLLKGAKK